MTWGRRARACARALAVLVVLGVVGVGGATGAWAHNYVVGSDPEADHVVSEPIEDVSITFSDVLLDLGGDGQGTSLEVVGPDGAHHATACPVIDGTAVSAPVALGVPGTYTVTWRVVSADGHPISGEYAFVYEPSTAGDPSAGSPEPACDRAAAAQGATTAATGPSDAGDGISPVMVVVIAAATAAVAGGGVILALRLGRRR